MNTRFILVGLTALPFLFFVYVETRSWGWFWFLVAGDLVTVCWLCYPRWSSRRALRHIHRELCQWVGSHPITAENVVECQIRLKRLSDSAFIHLGRFHDEDAHPEIQRYVDYVEKLTFLVVTAQ